MSQVVLITGVGKRLGFKMAEVLIQEGYEVAGTYRTEYPGLNHLRKLGVTLYQIDFYLQEQVDSLIEELIDSYSSIRAIIHNASDWMPDPDIKQDMQISAAETMHRMMTIHTSIPYQFNLALQHQLRDNRCADIIHIGDFVAEKGSKKHIAYAASKAAMINLTLSFAALLAPEVKVNSISPALLKFNPEDKEQYKSKALAKALLPREAGFDEVIEGVKMLLNSRFMTGRNLQFDGGRHLK